MPQIRNLWVLIAIASLAACKNKGSEPMFKDLTHRQTGIDFSNRLSHSEAFNMIDYLYYFDGGGVAVGDINNDGLSDIYLVSNEQENRLYLNLGDMKFKDITQDAGVASPGLWKTGVSMADVNGDGLLDIYLCRLGSYKGVEGANQLFINQGDLTFKEAAQQYNLNFKGFSTQAAFFDMDNDGDLDVYLLNHSVHSPSTFGDANLRNDRDSLAGDRLYRNDNNYFTDVSSQSGIYQSQVGYGLGIALSDIDDNGYTDIFIANDFTENDYLYLNQGDGSFREVFSEQADHTSLSSMGCDIADYNNDGLADLVVLDMLPADDALRKSIVGEDPGEIFRMKLNQGYMPQYKRNTLQLNQGNGHFSEVAMMAGVHATDWSWAPLFADFDNDGWKDLFITNGISGRPNDLDYLKFINRGDIVNAPNLADSVLLAQMPSGKIANYFFRNTQNLSFSDYSEVWGAKTNLITQGVAYSDLDNDGDLDLILNNTDTLAFIKENQLAQDSATNFISLDLQGSLANTKAVGAKVEVFSQNTYQRFENYPTRGFKSSVDSRIHVGLGNVLKIDSIIVTWPGRIYSVHRDISVNQRLTLTAPTNTYQKPRDSTKTIYVQVAGQSLGINYQHDENRFIEFNREPLIPFMHAQEGPALAVGDVNGDGLDDFFIGGAKHQAATIYIQNRDSFSSHQPLSLLNDKLAEDIDAVFFDFDKDHDADLLVLSGGNEFEGKSPNRQPRLYENDGKGNFTPVPGAFQNVYLTGSCIAVHDFDNDGWLDLFLGALVQPWNYGASPQSYLLRNMQGQGWEDLSNTLPANGQLGMISDALWMDLNGTGTASLILAGEWMDMQVLSWTGNGFEVDQIDYSAGFWKSLESFDYDGDGDSDLLAANMGLNSKFKASKTEPLRLYLQDFDRNGKIDPIITLTHLGKESIFASQEVLARQVPSVAKLFESNQAFAEATPVGILGETFSETDPLSIYELRSGVFINDQGQFHFQPFENLLQIGFLRDFLIHDFNQDGVLDFLAGGNMFPANRQHGRYDANLGVMTSGSDLSTLPSLHSGVYLEGDVRKIKSITFQNQEYLMAVRNNDSILWFKRK